MYQKTSLVCLLLIVATGFLRCGGTEKGENRPTAPASSLPLHAGDDRYFRIDTGQSVITWKGSNTFGTHRGYVYLSGGELMIENGQLTGGAAEIDMTSIEDDNHKSDNNLIKHLKDADFFDVGKFPTTKIVITGSRAVNAGDGELTGNLTIKGITHAVSFPVTMGMKDGVVNAGGKLVIDRTKWDVRYKSGKFFDNLKDGAISDDIEFEIKIVARK